MRFFFSFLMIIFIVANVLAQKKDDSTFLRNQNFALHIGAGPTLGFNKFEQAKPSNPNFVPSQKLSANLDLGLDIFHKKRWFSSYSWTQYNSTYGVSATIQGNENDWFVRRIREKYINYNYWSATLQFGRIKSLKDTRWQVNWLAGINLEFVVPKGQINFDLGDNQRLSLKGEDAIVISGIAPNLQAGYQVAFRGNRMGLSLKMIGNLGLRYYGSIKYEAWMDNEQFFATVKTKNDFIAAILQYEVYFGNK